MRTLVTPPETAVDLFCLDEALPEVEQTPLGTKMCPHCWRTLRDLPSSRWDCTDGPRYAGCKQVGRTHRAFGTQSDNATDAACPVCILSPNPNSLHMDIEDRATLVAWGEAGGPIPDSNQVIDAPPLPGLDRVDLSIEMPGVYAQTICR